MIKGGHPPCFSILTKSDLTYALAYQPEIVCVLHDYTLQQTNGEISNTPIPVKLQIRRDFLLEVNEDDNSIKSGTRFTPDFEFEVESNHNKEKEKRKDGDKEISWIIFRWKENSYSSFKERKFKVMERKSFENLLKNLKKQFITEVIEDFSHYFKPEQGIQGESKKFKIFFAKRKQDNIQFTVKAFSRKKFPERELFLIKDLHHSNICRIEKIYRTENTYYLLLQSHKISLFNWLQMSERERIPLRVFIQKLLKAIDYLHGKGIMHRDIKPANIMLKQGSLEPTIIDFDLAQKLNTKQLWVPFCGTDGYMAPEICALKLKSEENSLKAEDVRYDESCDMFSLGITLFEILTFSRPFTSVEKNELLRQNEKCQINFNIPQFTCLPDEFKNILKGLLKKNPKQRLTAKEILTSSLFREPQPSKNSFSIAKIAV